MIRSNNLYQRPNKKGHIAVLLFHCMANLKQSALYLATLLLLAPVSRAQSPIVATQSGTVSGELLPGHPRVAAFKGIPYAAPPVGPLRWRPPQPVVPWAGVRKANAFSPSCMQVIRGEHLPWTREFMAQLPTSEDCLYLNVWTPLPIDKAAHLPVLLWIHGGGLIEGAAAPAVYGGASLARRGIIVVSVNYRLGVFGFLAHPELAAESPQHAAGDYGFLDILAALQWIHTNIASFASPLAKGLFRAVIAESGADADPPRTATLADAEANGTKFATLANTPSLAQLRALSADDLLHAQVAAQLPFRPTVDGWFLPQSIPEIFAAGHQNDVPTITGFNADEGSASTNYGHTTAAQFISAAQRNFGDHAAEFLHLYPATTDAEAQASQKASRRDEENVSVLLWAEQRALTSHTAAYAYFFTRAIPWPQHPEFAAFHSAEIPYALDNLNVLDRPWQPIDRTLARTVTTYWLNFIRTTNPNGSTVPQWRAAAAHNNTTIMELGAHTGPIPVASPEIINFWRSRLIPNP